MTKQDFINVVANETGASKSLTTTILEAVLANLKKEVREGETVVFRGFGKFFAYESKPRKGRNFKTGKTMDIPATAKFKFKAF